MEHQLLKNLALYLISIKYLPLIISEQTSAATLDGDIEMDEELLQVEESDESGSVEQPPRNDEQNWERNGCESSDESEQSDAAYASSSDEEYEPPLHLESAEIS